MPLTVNPKDVEIPSYFPDIPEVRNDIARSILILRLWMKSRRDC